jgi:hypothetical protein
MKNSKEAVRFEEIFPAIDFLTAELDKIRGGANAAATRCEVGVSCNPTGIIDDTQLQISAF